MPTLTVETKKPKELGTISKAVVTVLMTNGQVVYGLAVLILPSYASELQASSFSLGVIFSSYAFAILVSSSLFAKLSVNFT